ncbi:MAG: hypothetical protein WC471_01985 [Candidatus Woesearchaeota archaeon]
MIKEFIEGLTEKISAKSISKLVAEGILHSTKDIEQHFEQKINEVVQKNINVAVKKFRKQLLQTGLLTFSIILIVSGLLMVLGQYFPMRYLMLATGFILLSIAIISK